MLARRHLANIPADIAISILVSTVLVLINLHHGLISTPDTVTFSRWADSLIDLRFNLMAYYDQNQFVSSPVFYTLPVSLIALLKVVFGVHWVEIFHAINIFALIYIIETFRRSARLLDISAFTVATVLPLFLFTTDFIIWPHYLLTDTIFAAGVMASVHSTLHATLKNRSYNLSIACCALLLLTRPTSPPIVASILLFLVFKRLPKLVINKKYQPWFLLLTVIVFSLVYGAAFEALLSNPPGSEQLTFIGSMISKGIVIHDRPDTFIEINPTYLEITRLFLLRLIMFFSPYASTISTSHILANCVVLIPFFASVIGWIILPLEPGESKHKSAQFLLFTILFVAIFHAATLIDFDWRYRFPLIAPMFLFVATMLDCCSKYVSRNASDGI
jgi:hypothetical protein